MRERERERERETSCRGGIGGGIGQQIHLLEQQPCRDGSIAKPPVINDKSPVP